MTAPSIDVSVFLPHDSLRRYVPPRAAHPPASIHSGIRLSIASVAALFHVLIVLAWISGLGSPEARRPRAHPGREGAITAYFIDGPDNVPLRQATQPLSIWTLRDIKVIDLPLPRFGLPEDFTRVGTNVARSTALARDSLWIQKLRREQYLTHIQAHLLGSWQLTGTSVRHLHYPDCTAHVTQSTTGSVVAVALSSCPEDPQLQELLISAVNSATPFPLPERPELFVAAIDIQFDTPPRVEGREIANIEASVTSQITR